MKPLKLSHWIILIITVVVLICGISLFFAVLETRQALHQLQTAHFDQATRHSTQALFIVRPLSALTFHHFATLEAWQAGLETIPTLSELTQTTRAYLPATLQSDPAAQKEAAAMKQQLPVLIQKLTHLVILTQHSQFLSSQLTARYPQYAAVLTSPHLSDNLQDINTLTQTILTGHQKYIVLLQNSQELRATGGFMGSYAVIELSDGVINNLSIHDIYEPDGQFTGFITPPPGVDEYLSEGKGQRLPNANWNPDFPSSAQDILQFFALAKEQDVKGIAAINLDVTQRVLDVIGPIYLPDYHTYLTADNLPELARADRNQFFPGSQQKKNFLQAAFTQLKLQLQALPLDKQKQIVSILWSEAQNKNIQAFSHDAAVQQLFLKYHLAGEMTSHFDTTADAMNARYFFLVESNVGINKANKGVIREVKLVADPKHTQILIYLHNHNPVSTSSAMMNTATPLHPINGDLNLHYADYQRIFINAPAQVTSMTIGGKPLDHWNEQIITSSSGEEFKQVGFIVPVPENTNQTVIVQVSYPLPLPYSFIIQKQSGLPPVSYLIQVGAVQKPLVLETDENVTISP